jgi:hypothetical protein
MRTLAAVSTVALLLGALGLGCVEDHPVPARHARAVVGSDVGSTVAMQPRHDEATVQPAAPRAVAPRAYAPLQPALSPSRSIVNNVTESPPPRGAGTNVAPPAYGVTEAQASSSSEDRERVAKAVGSASMQIDRLQRIQSMSAETHREGLDGALYDLQHKREKVLADLRELDLQPATERVAIRSELDHDLVDLQTALRMSYEFAPPPAQGLPPPAPLAP